MHDVHAIRVRAWRMHAAQVRPALFSSDDERFYVDPQLLACGIRMRMHTMRIHMHSHVACDMYM